MAQFLPALIMFAITVGVCALFALPMRLWKPADRIVGFYWRGVWMFLIAITSVAGGMNTLVLAGLDVVGPTEILLRIILGAFVLFVVVGWFQLVGLGALTVGRKLFARRPADLPA